MKKLIIIVFLMSGIYSLAQNNAPFSTTGKHTFRFIKTDSVVIYNGNDSDRFLDHYYHDFINKDGKHIDEGEYYINKKEDYGYLMPKEWKNILNEDQYNSIEIICTKCFRQILFKRRVWFEDRVPFNAFDDALERFNKLKNKQ